MRRRERETTRTVVDDLSDLLEELPLTGLQRHWADEYLRDLRDGVLSSDEREELEELRGEVREMEWQLDRIRSVVD